MAIILSNRIDINHYPEFKGKDLVEIKIIYKPDDSHSSYREILGEFLLTKEAALQFSKEITLKYS